MVVDSPQVIVRLMIGDTLDNFGRFIAPAGDLNNDGFDDVWIGRTSDNVFTEYFLYLGGNPFDTVPDFRLRLAAKGIYNVGDFNNDNIDDLIIIHGDSSTHHARYFGLHFGGLGFLELPDLAFPVHDTTADIAFARSVIGGDFDADGKPDLLLGEPTGNSLGGSYFYSNKPVFDTVSDLVFMWGEFDKQFQCGITSTYISDFDGNDYIAIGVLGNSGTGDPGAAVFFRAGAQIDSVPEFVFHYPGTPTDFAFGTEITPLGDANGDGYNDFILGAVGYDSRIYFGNELSDTTPDITVLPQHEHTEFAGDMNYDGYPDFVVSEQPFQGRVWIYYGGPEMDGIVDMKIIPQIEVVNFGSVCRYLGDVNGDGCPDIAIKGTIDSFGVWPGVVYIYGGYGKIPVDVPEDQIIPSDLSLHQNYPNPFNPSTTILFELPRRANVTLTVHNILGQVVARLIDAELTAGEHSTEWDGRDSSGKPASSGIYLYRLTTDTGTLSRKMLLLK